MQITDSLVEARLLLDRARREGGQVGFVPTMGYLHEGHASLMRRSRTECDLVAATIFVNPLQFGVGEDYASYPRDLERDSSLAAEAGVDLLIVPTVDEMYPSPVLTSVSVAGITERFEGATRPGHFAGVTTVVSKLFNIVGPCMAYFGEKDWQQLAVVRRMVADLSVPVEVVGCPTVRAQDGLALSSRNAYLSQKERAAAPVLHNALMAGTAMVEDGSRSAEAVEQRMREVIATRPEVVLDYVAAVEADTLEAVGPLQGDVRLLIAARIGKPRLLDNVGVTAE